MVKRRRERWRVLQELLESTRELRRYWVLKAGEVYQAKQRLRAAGVPVPKPRQDVESLEPTPKMSADEIAERYRQGRFAELSLEQAGDELSGHVTPAAGNVFSDLGFSPEVAGALLASADAELKRGDAVERPDVAEPGAVRTVEVRIHAPQVEEFLARVQHPVFKQAARMLEQSVPEDQGFGRFRDKTKDDT